MSRSMDVSESRSDVAENPHNTPAQSSSGAMLRYSSLGLILLLWFAIYFVSIFKPALLDDVDSVHAEAAREMVLRHDWVTLYTDGIRYLEKAPLMYWAVAASY